MVYVDDMEAEFGNMIMCHMIADTTDELNQMADKIGVKRKWIQYPGTYKEHYDICQTMRNTASMVTNLMIRIQDTIQARKVSFKGYVLHVRQ